MSKIYTAHAVLTSYYGTGSTLGRSPDGRGGKHSFTLNQITYTGYFTGSRSSSSNRYGTLAEFEGLDGIDPSRITSITVTLTRDHNCYTNSTYGVNCYYSVPTGAVEASMYTGNSIITANRVSTSFKSTPTADTDGTQDFTFSASLFELIRSNGIAWYYRSGNDGRHIVIKDVVITVETDEVEHTLSYDANGGSGAPSDQKTYGEPITISAVTPSWIGHSFQGWATSSTATQETYRPGGTITISQDTTLYAVWKLITYDVTYNANGGIGAPSRQEKTYGVSLQLTEDVPTWTGHTFQGWATSASGDVAYMPGDTYSVNASLALYAVWKLDQYTVTYYANGGSGAPAAQKKNYNATITLSQTVPVYPGYEFVKWNTDPYGLGTDYQGGQSYSANHDLDLYAIWTPAGVRVNFNANGGACDTDYLTLYPGQPYGELPQAIYPGHTFDGWFTAPVDGDQVLPTTIVETGEEHTLFAHWTAAPSPGRHAGEIYCKRNGRMLHGVLYTKKDGVMLRGQFYTM